MVIETCGAMGTELFGTGICNVKERREGVQEAPLHGIGTTRLRALNTGIWVGPLCHVVWWARPREPRARPGQTGVHGSVREPPTRASSRLGLGGFSQISFPDTGC